jgi:hypothetical protein
MVADPPWERHGFCHFMGSEERGEAKGLSTVEVGFLARSIRADVFYEICFLME